MSTEFRSIALAGFAVAALIIAPALAQDDVDVALTEPDPVFDIEVIVFEYVEGVRGAREDWRYIDTGRDAVARTLPDTVAAMLAGTGAQDSAQTTDDEPVPALSQPRKSLQFEPIASDNLRLSDTYARLRNSRDFRPIAHAGWRQPVFDRNNETTLDLARVARLPSNLEGKASVYVSRFLHLTLDLQLAGNRAVSSGLDSIVFSLNERRKTRSGELNFYDHPRFGALTLISRTDQPAASEPSE
ncbi:MAG: CsiV family protein [Pseudomonadota bacterium]